ncbi:MAG: pyridoxamine 5-phosphate oxidase [Rhodobacteraceae bacterium]|nr:pyridoxamine 5-phosphate oxidase [Paracoccaceae bacterium]
MSEPPSPIRPTTEAACALARSLIAGAQFGALGVLHPVTGIPHVARIALAPAIGGGFLALLSGLALHSQAMAKAPVAGILIGEPGPKGDPLSHPRLSLSVTARFVPAQVATEQGLRARWLAQHPKARVYVDLPDFRFMQLAPTAAFLNGGFGKAFALTAEDLMP